MKEKHIKDTPLISVIIPAYNASQTITDAIESALLNRASVEIIVCNDYSSDSTCSIIKKIRDPRIKLINNQKNLGPGLSRDRAINIAKGKWLAFLDADDMFTPNRLDKLLDAVGKLENTIVMDDILRCHDTPKGLVSWKPFSRSRIASKSEQPYFITPEEWLGWKQTMVQPIIPTHLVKGFYIKHSGLRYAEDLEFFLLLISKTSAQILHYPKPLYLYRLRAGSLSTNKSRFSILDNIYSCAKNEWFKGNDSMIRVIDKCKEKNNKNMLYRVFLSSLSKGNFYLAAQQAFNDPKLLLTLTTRLLSSIPYHFSRITNRGNWRKKDNI